MAEWRQRSLGNLCEDGVVELQTGPFGSQLHAYDYVPDGIPVVPAEAIRNRQIDHSVLPKITAVKAGALERHRLRPGDILFARRGVQATGHVGYVRDAEDGFICGTGAIRLRIKQRNGQVLPEFLSHVLANPASVQWFKFHSIGATMPNLNEGIIRVFVLAVPPVGEQEAIASLLSAFDDKIELSRQMNETLEATARALFKSWFVDFDPVRAKAEGRELGLPRHLAGLFPDSFENSELGEIPNGWRVGKVADLASLSRDGLNPGEFPQEAFCHFSIPAFDEGRRPRIERGEAIRSNKLLVPPDAVLLSKLNPRIPRMWLADVPRSRRAICSTEFLVTLPRGSISREFLFCLLSGEFFGSVFATLVTGTSGSHQRVQAEGLLEMDAVIPREPVIHEFTGVVRPLLARGNRALDESESLAALRDALLPKLVSGELRIKDAERISAGAL